MIQNNIALSYYLEPLYEDDRFFCYDTTLLIVWVLKENEVTYVYVDKFEKLNYPDMYTIQAHFIIKIY